MARLIQLDQILFPVDEHPIFASVQANGTEHRLRIPGKLALVNRQRGRVVGIVGCGYRLVTNREALSLAYECCRTVFPETRPVEWEVGAVDAPSTAGHCCIDLVHRSAALDFEFTPAASRPEAFGPFIRVTNSYNGLRALAFDLGFHRKVCSNGMIHPRSVIRFKFIHAKREIGPEVRFEVAREELAALRASFCEYLGALRACRVPRARMAALASAVLGLRKPRQAEPGTPLARDWDGLCGRVSELCDRYAEELGENAYAALNAITDFASHPPENRCLHRERHSLQRLAGAWLGGFARDCREPDFSLEDHIARVGASNEIRRDAAAARRVRWS